MSTRLLTTWRRPIVVEAVVFAVALTVRLLIPMSSAGGLGGLYPYDPSVYYAAADALTHGLLPYRDFLLVHPPGLPIALTPFALLGRLTSDHVGFVSANLAVTVLGALNAALVVRLARRLGLDLRAAMLGGLLYAACLGSVVAEFSARLEPLGNFLLLSALLVIGGRDITPRRALVAGALLGLAVDVKIWWLPAVAVVAVAIAVATRSVRRGLLALAGAAGAIVVVLAPFFYAAPHLMFRMIVQAQVDRISRGSPLRERLSVIATSNEISLGAHKQIAVAVGLVVVVLAATALAASRRPTARVAAAVLVVNFGVLLLGANVLGYYVDYLMVPAGIVLAACADVAFRARRERLRRTGWAWASVLVVATVVMIVGTSSPPHSGSYVTRFPQADKMIRAAALFHCVQSDAPGGLIELDALDRSFRNHCRNWVDVTAPRLGVLGHRYLLARGVPDQPWSNLLQRYLASGDAILAIRSGIGLNGYALIALKRGGIVASDGRYTIYRTVPASRHIHR